MVLSRHMGGEFLGGDFPNWGGGELSPKFPLHSSVELPPNFENSLPQDVLARSTAPSKIQ